MDLYALDRTVPSAGMIPPSGRGPTPVSPDFPGYVLLELLGEGGMGTVWKARQTTLNWMVALKMVLGEQRAGSKDMIPFLAEAVAAVKQPDIVQVYQYGEADGRPFPAMEYFPGGSLSDRIGRAGSTRNSPRTC
jgi:serine/threonine-protein kinase